MCFSVSGFSLTASIIRGIVSAVLYDCGSMERISGAEGYQSSCIFSTNNLRQFTESIVEYLFDKDRSHLGKTRFYGTVLLAFHAGAAAGYLAGVSLGVRASWICLLPVLTAAVLVSKSALPERENAVRPH